MKFTLSWLKDHLETDATLDQIGEALTSIGLEVEEIVDPASKLTGFITGHVLTAEKHPDADRLKLCTVSTGSETLQIVCGAPNARAGLKVALALPGCVIPVSGDVLKKGKVRGQESQAMMCSTRELCLGEDHDGIIELPEDTPVGVPLASVLSIDPVIDISVTPNRADCLGVRGIARDLAAFGVGTLKADPLTEGTVAGQFESPVKVVRRLPEGKDAACPLFVGRLIRGVKNGESPQWLKDRLVSVGLRPISALVDITNYVTVGWNRPLHVFDADKLTGNIVVKMATPGTELPCLNDKTYMLEDWMVAIADEAGDLSVGGVVGGTASGCTEQTVNVFVEAALFDPLLIAATGRKLTAESDAKHRFERGVDPESPLWGMELATRLILDLCGGTPSAVEVGGAVPDWKRTITLRPERVKKLVGIDVAPEKMVSLLTGLGCTATLADGVITAVAPSWRGDLTEEHDLVEEVARLNGYDNLVTLPLPRPSMPTPVLTARQKTIRLLTRTLAARGMNETVTWSFMSSDKVAAFGGGQDSLKLANPISSDLDSMRPSILPNLIDATVRNAARGFADVALFEVGPQFHGGNPGDQKQMVTGLRAGKSGPRHWDVKQRPVDALDARADALAVLKAAGVNTDSLQVSTDAPDYYHPGRSGCLRLGRDVLATFGDLHPRVARDFGVKGALAGFEVFLDALPQPKTKGGKSVSKARSLLKASPFQPLERDFAFVVDSTVAAEALIRAAKGADKALITDASVFDVYEGEHMPAGKKSVALWILLQPTDHTLTDEELDAVSKKVVAAIEKATGGILRG